MLTLQNHVAKIAAPPERWLPVPGYEALYAVSDHGRVRSLVQRHHWAPRVLSPTQRVDGYLVVGLIDTDGAQRSGLVHRLVLTAFEGPRDSSTHAAHLNGDKADNRRCNLVWSTPAENEAHKRAHGTDGSGERNAGAKLTWAQVDAIRARPRRRGECTAIAEEYGITVQTAWDIVTGRRWNPNNRPEGVAPCSH